MTARLLSALRASATAFSATWRAEAPIVTSRRFWIGLVILLLSLAALVAGPSGLAQPTMSPYH